LRKFKKPSKAQRAKNQEQAKRDAGKKGINNEDDEFKNKLTIEGFTPDQESWIRYELKKLLTPNCSAAYEVSQNPLRSPRTIMETGGVVIRHADVLTSRSAEDLGLSPESFRNPDAGLFRSRPKWCWY
jgi:hypothetical protein